MQQNMEEPRTPFVPDSVALETNAILQHLAHLFRLGRREEYYPELLGKVGHERQVLGERSKFLFDRLRVHLGGLQYLVTVLCSRDDEIVELVCK